MDGLIKVIDEINLCWKINFFKDCDAQSYFYCKVTLLNKEFTFILCGDDKEWQLQIEPQKDVENDYEDGFNIRIYRTDGSSFLNENAIKKFHEYDEDSFYYENPTPMTKEDLLLLNDISNSDHNLRVFFTYIPVIRKQQVNLPVGDDLTSSSLDVVSKTASLEAFGTLSKDFKALLTSARHTDVKLKVGDKEFQAHKSVLAARSQVFDSMFSQNMLENISGVINISDCDADVFEAFLTFLYSGQLDEIPSSIVVGLYDIADKYDLPELKKECVKRLIIELSVDSVCDALRVAALHEEKELMETAKKFFVENTEEILDNPNWESFQKDHQKIGNELFKCYIHKTREIIARKQL